MAAVVQKKVQDISKKVGSFSGAIGWDCNKWLDCLDCTCQACETLNLPLKVLLGQDKKLLGQWPEMHQ